MSDEREPMQESGEDQNQAAPEPEASAEPIAEGVDEATAEPVEEGPNPPYLAWWTPPPQPEPWKPSPRELDPNSDAGWDKAAAHELVAIRPEDIPPPPEAEPATEAEHDHEDGIAAASAGAATAAGATATGEPIPFPGAIEVPAQQTPPRPPLRTRAASRARSAAGATRSGIVRGVRFSARPLLVIALFTAGVTLGWMNYNRTLPVSTGTQTATQQANQPEPGTTTTTPPQVLSLLAALNEDNQALIQTVVPAEPYRLLAGELAARGISAIRGSRAMSTYVRGTDSATEILIAGTDNSGGESIINLVVHISNGVITSFR